MNPAVQRYLPPAIVFATALYFGWPPAAPLDLGDDVVRATSVRWRPDDLKTSPPIEIQADPFVEVLIVEAPDEAIIALPVEPDGPPEAELKAGIRLDGFANTGGRFWAVLNGRPRLPGDSIRTSDVNRHLCELVDIQADHVVVRCEGTVTKIHPRVPGSRSRRKTQESTEEQDMTSAVEATATEDIAPPPAP